MALRILPSSHFLAAFLPVAQSILRPNFAIPLLRQRPQTSTSESSTSTAVQSWIPSFPASLSDIWESILRAVPKKKTSHAKKRHRQMAGKALKDVKSVNTCPGCGRMKKAHTMCPYCYQTLREWFGKEKQAKRDASQQTGGTRGEAEFAA